MIHRTLIEIVPCGRRCYFLGGRFRHWVPIPGSLISLPLVFADLVGFRSSLKMKLVVVVVVVVLLVLVLVPVPVPVLVGAAAAAAVVTAVRF